MDENVLDVMGDAYLKKGLFKKDAYRLVFTEERVIFSHVTKDLRKQEQKELASELKGKKLKERLSASFHNNERICKRYQELSIEEILEMGTESFSLPYKDIKKVKRHIMTDEESNLDTTTVILNTISNKLKLTFPNETVATKIYKMLKEKNK